MKKVLKNSIIVIGAFLMFSALCYGICALYPKLVADYYDTVWANLIFGIVAFVIGLLIVFSTYFYLSRNN